MARVRVRSESRLESRLVRNLFSIIRAVYGFEAEGREPNGRLKGYIQVRLFDRLSGAFFGNR